MPSPGDLAGVITCTPLKTSAYTADPGDYVRADTTSGSFTVTLPANPPKATVIGIKQIATSGGNTTTVACSGADVFNKTGGSTSLTLTLQGQGVQMLYKSGIWLVTADDLPLSGLDSRYAPYGGGGSYAAGGLTPASNGLLAWNFPPYTVRSSDHAASVTAGLLYVSMITVPVACTVTNLVYGMVQAGTGLTPGGNFAGLFYGPSGATPYGLVAATADQTANFGLADGTPVTAPLTSPQGIAAGTYYGGWFFTGSGTAPVPGYGDTPFANIGLAGAPYVSATGTSGLTTAMPPVIGTQAGNGYFVTWFGLS